MLNDVFIDMFTCCMPLVAGGCSPSFSQVNVSACNLCLVIVMQSHVLFFCVCVCFVKRPLGTHHLTRPFTGKADVWHKDDI